MNFVPKGNCSPPEGLYPFEISSPLGDKVHPWGTNSPLGVKLKPGLWHLKIRKKFFDIEKNLFLNFGWIQMSM
jgi:hypothetical protein